MARATPSIGAYRFSAPFKNLEPAKVIFQPVWQQSGFYESQSQYFCRSQYPMPVFDQSGHKHVRRCGSYINTPFFFNTDFSTVFSGSRGDGTVP